MQVRKRRVEYVEISYKPHQKDKVMEFIAANKYSITDQSTYGNGPYTIWAERTV